VFDSKYISGENNLSQKGLSKKRLIYLEKSVDVIKCTFCPRKNDEMILRNLNGFHNERSAPPSALTAP
jgi:hypothetical protein